MKPSVTLQNCQSRVGCIEKSIEPCVKRTCLSFPITGIAWGSLRRYARILRFRRSDVRSATAREPISGVWKMRRTDSTCSSRARSSNSAGHSVEQDNHPGGDSGRTFRLHLCFCAPKGGVRGSSARATSDVVVLEVKFAGVIAKLPRSPPQGRGSA